MMEDFSGLALPPLFGGHILEAELETGGVELGPSGSELLDNDGPPSGSGQDGEDERRELDKRKYQALSKRCKEIEQVNCFCICPELCCRAGVFKLWGLGALRGSVEISR